MYSDNDFRLYHHGIKGQKWGIQHGPPYPLKDGNTFKLKAKRKLVRYSTKKEKSVRNGAYASVTKHDVDQYKKDSFLGLLGADKAEKIFSMKLSAVDDLTIRTGKAMVEDVVKQANKKRVTKYYNTLNDANYFDMDINQRYDLFSNDKAIAKARNKLGTEVHKEIYKDRKGFAEKYRKAGYDAVVDPEDLIWNYEMPLIITNARKLRIDDATELINKGRYVLDEKRKEG